MATKCLWLVTTLLLCSNHQVQAIHLEPRATTVVTLDSAVLKVVHTANERLLSLTLDSIFIRKRWIDQHMRDEKFLKVTSLLAPAYLRVGGTDSDAMLFRESSSLGDAQHEGSSPRDLTTFYMSGEEWKLINEFVSKADLKLVFSLNALHRKGTSWDPSNAKQLLDFSDKQGYNLSFQLGNEPDRFNIMFHKNVTTNQLATDFATLRSLLDSYPRYKSSLLIGPDISSSDSYLESFLTSQNSTLSAISAHHYYISGKTAKLPDFYNATILNSLVSYITTMEAVITSSKTTAPFWLGETSSASSSGATNITDRFVAGFMWLDKISLAAKLRVDVVCRQNLYGNKYGLLNLINLDPNPDWWLSVLYKKLVGVGVLNTTIPTGSVRLYAHCSKTSPGSVVLFGMNVNSKDVEVQLKGSQSALEKGKVAAYVLTGEHGLQSQTVLLNGKRLELNKDYSLPPLEPEIVVASPLHLPAFSLVFFVIEDITVAACKEI